MGTQQARPIIQLCKIATQPPALLNQKNVKICSATLAEGLVAMTRASATNVKPIVGAMIDSASNVKAILMP
jgi:hypothetical protein